MAPGLATHSPELGQRAYPVLHWAHVEQSDVEGVMQLRAEMGYGEFERRLRRDIQMQKRIGLLALLPEFLSSK